MSWIPKTDYNPDHYTFQRTCKGFYPPRETHEDKLADRVVLIVSVLVICLILAGVLR